MGTDARLTDAIEACRSDWDAGSSESAVAFAGLLERWPDSAEAQYAAAIGLEDAGRVEQAVMLYEQALNGSSGADLRHCFARLANALRGAGEPDLAVELLEQGLDEFPGSRSLRTFLALTLHAVGRSDAALGLAIAVLIDPTPSPDLELFAPELRMRSAILLGRDA